MTKPKPNPQPKLSYYYLLEDPDVKRWYDNVARGSLATSAVWLRRMGFIHKNFRRTPQDLAKMSSKEAMNFVLDVVSNMEKSGKRGGYISSVMRPLKSWFTWNQIPIVQKVKISGKGEPSTVADERPPTPDELRTMLHAGDLRGKTSIAIIAFSGVRIEVLGDFLGNDGLKVKDILELSINNGEPEFSTTPAMIVVRKNLSKNGRQFFTFLNSEGCDYLKQYLKWRIMRGEKITKESPIITPVHDRIVGDHIRTTNISDLIRKAIRDASYLWRPYVLRRYFDVRMMLAEADGMIIRDYRQFWMGHTGDIEATYTVNKGLSKDVIEKMRSNYGKAAEKYLSTSRRDSIGREEILKTMNSQFLRMSGYSDAEISKIGNLADLAPDQLQDLVKRKMLESIGIGNNKQLIVPFAELRNYVMQGFEFVAQLPNHEAIIRLPSS